MKQPVHLLVPMSGQGTRYQKAGYTLPKPLIPVNNIPMIQRLLENFPASWPAYFVLAENHKSTDLPQVLKKARPAGKISFIPVHDDGPAPAIEEGLKNIPADAPVFVSYCDYGMVWDAARFEKFVAESDCDACVISYRGFHAHYLSPVTYAYSRLEGERVVEVREKGSFTDNRENEFASSGGYYFKSGELLKEALAYQRKKDLRTNGELYTSLTVEALLQMKPDSHVRVFEIPGFFQWGTPADLEDFSYWEKTFQAYHPHPTLPLSGGGDVVSQILMPMAGLGSRLEKIFSVPKPFIRLHGVPMFERALASLPSARKTVVVTLKKVKEFLTKSTHTFVYLDKTPEGQALSTLAGLNSLDAKKDVIVSACDHAVILGDIWKRFIKKPDCDAAIFTIRGFPGARRNPKAFTYVAVKEPKVPFPEVTNVSVKKCLSDHPERDELLVGTFWFKTAGLLREGIDDLIAAGDRVNNELYLDGIFNTLISAGKKVRIIPLQGYINWGDPDSLAEALYWQETFNGQRLEARPRYSGATS